MGNINLVNNCDNEKTDKTGKCESQWTYLDKANFGNHKKITANLLRTYAEDLHYLKDETEELWETTDPINRKYENPIPIDQPNSWGIVKGTDGNIHFDNRTRFTGSTLFKNYNTIDKDNTTAFVDTAYTENYGCVTIPPQQQDIVTTTECQGSNKGGLAGCNAHWYISFNRTKTYNVQTDWKENLDSTEIPAISRKQTFKPKTSGRLESITFNLTGTPDAEYPLIVQVFDEETTPVTEIAKAEHKFESTSAGGLTAIAFKEQPVLTEGHKYSFVLRSPLTSYKNHYGIGGWGKTCNIDPYKDGECYLSENNASKLGTWIRYGRNEKTLSYHNGQKQPIDFGFQCHIRPTEPKYDTTKEYVIYFKTQQMNPVKEVRIFPTDEIPNNTEIHYEFSPDGKTWTEFPTNTSNRTIYLERTSIFVNIRARLKTTDSTVTPRIKSLAIECQLDQPKSAYLRTEFYSPEKAKILGASVWNSLRAPYNYNPSSAVTDSNGNRQCSVLVDVVRNTVITERFKMLPASKVVDYIREYYIEKYQQTDKDLDGYVDSNRYITRLNSDGITTEHANEIENIINTLKGASSSGTSEYDESKVLAHLQTTTTDSSTGESVTVGNEIMDWLNNNRRVFVNSVTKKFPLSEHPAYPMTHISLQLANTEEEENKIKTAEANGETYTPEPTYTNYKEWVDYEIGNNGKYDEPVLYFGTSDEPTTLPEGDLTVEYYPLWIRGLSEKDFLKLDSTSELTLTDNEWDVIDENSLSRYPNDLEKNSFKMDIMVDSYPIIDTNAYDFKLSVNPMQMLREVWVEDSNGVKVVLEEDVDFTVDYNNRMLSLTNVELAMGDTLYVKYTPYLTDDGLALAYRLERQNTGVDVDILPYFFEYRV